MRRYPPRPIVGVGALLFRGDQILLIQRGREPLIGWWSLPGGALEVGETLEEGVRREVFEETGLDVQPLRVVEIFERIMTDRDNQPEYHYVLVDFVCRIRGGTPRPGDDVSHLEWVPTRRLSRYRLTEGTLEVIRRAYRNRRRRSWTSLTGAIGPLPAE